MQKLILFTLLLICISAAHHDYVLYVFDREWAGSVCQTHRCKSDYIINHKGDEFNVHGLWPSGKPGNEKYHMMDCEDYHYDQEEIAAPLLDWMNRDYVSLYNPAIGFRAHEYEKHGSCYNYASSVKTNEQKENAFFGKIKELTERYPLVSSLEKAGIYPSNTEKYQYEDIVSALQEAFDTTELPSIGCRKKGGKQLLEVIQLCLDLDFNIRRCPQPKNSCKKNTPITYPPFKPHGDGFLGQEIY